MTVNIMIPISLIYLVKKIDYIIESPFQFLMFDDKVALDTDNTVASTI